MESQRSALYDIGSVLQLILASVLGCAILTSCGSKDAEGQNDWKTFSSKTGRFSAVFPGTPKVTTVSEPTAAGEMEMHNYIVEIDPQTAYGVNYTDYPDAIDLSDSERLFDRGQMMVVGVRGKVITQRAMKVQNYPAREFEFQAGGKANYSGRVRLVLAGRRIYSVVTVFLTANPHPAESARFLDSFSLNKN